MKGWCELTNDLLSFLDVVDLSDPVAVESDDRIPEVVVSDDRGPVFGLCVLTVPDVERIGLPGWYAANKEPVDLAGLAEMEWGVLKPLIMPSLPQEQLDEIEAAEQARDRPRKRVLDAVASERADRGERFPQWLAEKSRCVFSSRIAAVAWQDGNEPMCALSCATDDDERESLAAVGYAWREHSRDCRRNGGYDRIGFFDSINRYRAVIARSLSYGLESFRPQVFDVFQSELLGGLPLPFVARSVGIAEANIPEIATLADVWRVWRSEPGSHLLADWAAGQLQLERAVFQRCEDVLF